MSEENQEITMEQKLNMALVKIDELEQWANLSLIHI